MFGILYYYLSNTTSTSSGCRNSYEHKPLYVQFLIRSVVCNINVPFMVIMDEYFLQRN